MNTNINWIVPIRGSQKGPRGAARDYAFFLSNHVAGDKGSKKRAMQGVISVSLQVMKSMRWISGDRVLIGCDDTHIYIKRVTNGGYALSPVGGSDNAGKTVACSVKTSRITFPQTGPIIASQFAVLDDGTVMIEAKSEAA